jgi:hypothetical protein
MQLATTVVLPVVRGPRPWRRLRRRALLAETMEHLRRDVTDKFQCGLGEPMYPGVRVMARVVGVSRTAASVDAGEYVAAFGAEVPIESGSCP